MARLFRELDHTADLAISVEGADPSRLFARAALSLFRLLVDCRRPTEPTRRTVAVEGRDLEDLLHEWLSRLLSDFYTEGFVGHAIEIVEISPVSLSAELAGSLFDPVRCRVLREIKAVTYHQLRVAERDAGWEARVTFDV